MQNLDTFDMLSKMFMDRIITKEEKEKFGKKLKLHQLAKVNESMTVLDKAILEHNIIAASKIYEAITI